MPTLPKIITRTLSLKLSLMAVCEISLLLMVALAVMFHYSRKVLKEEAMIDAEHTLEGTAQHIDNVLLSVEQSAGNIYFDLLRHLDEPERMYDYSRHLVDSNPYIVGCAIVFKPHYYPGKELFMAYVRRKGYSLSADNTELVTQATYTERPYTEQEWYTKPMKREAPCWTDPLKNEDAEGEPLVSFCLPIRDKSDTCVGVLAADLPISLLSQIVLSAKPSAHGYSTLLADNGSYIVHPDSTKLNHQTVFYQLHEGADPSFIEDLAVQKENSDGVSAYSTLTMISSKNTTDCFIICSQSSLSDCCFYSCSSVSSPIASCSHSAYSRTRHSASPWATIGRRYPPHIARMRSDSYRGISSRCSRRWLRTSVNWNICHPT